MKKVVVAYDFSPYARRALGLALQGFPFEAQRVEVFHVCHERVFQEGFPDSKVPTVEQVETFLNAEIEQVSEALPVPMRKGVKTEIFVESGQPCDQILDHMESQKDAALILGGQGHGGLGEVFLGRTAQRILRKAEFSVQVVKNGSGSLEVVGPILCAVDYANPSRVALQEAAQLAKMRDETLAVIHVVDNPYVPYLRLMAVEPERDTAVRELLDEAPGKLANFVEEVLGKGVAFAAHTCFGPASEMIASHAHSIGAGLIVVASHGHGALGRMVMGSVAEGLVQKAPIDVLVIHTH